MSGRVIIQTPVRHPCVPPKGVEGDRVVWRCDCGTYWEQRGQDCWSSSKPGPIVRAKAAAIHCYDFLADMWRG